MLLLPRRWLSGRGQEARGLAPCFMLFRLFPSIHDTTSHMESSSYKREERHSSAATGEGKGRQGLAPGESRAASFNRQQPVGRRQSGCQARPAAAVLGRCRPLPPSLGSPSMR